MVRSKPRQILHIIGAYTMSCKQGSKRGAYIEPRANIYCALGYARANAQPKARQPTRPKGHFIYTFSFFSSFSLTKKHEPQGSCFFVVWGGDWKVRCIVEARRSARFYALRAASGADGSRPIPTLLPEKEFFRQTAGRIYASPTSRPIIFIIIYGRGRGMPRPYRAMFFIAP